MNTSKQQDTSTSNQCINVKEIMQGGKKAVLLHAEKRYLLSITRRGKLILTADESSIVSTPTVPSGGLSLSVP